jgi:hypothetical protein
MTPSEATIKIDDKLELRAADCAWEKGVVKLAGGNGKSLAVELDADVIGSISPVSRPTLLLLWDGAGYRDIESGMPVEIRFAPEKALGGTG